MIRQVARLNNWEQLRNETVVHESHIPQCRSVTLPHHGIHLAWPSVNLVARRLSLFLLFYSSLVTLFSAEPLAKGIQDNSFFVEEAYNQEPGIVQHIINVPAFFTSGDKEASFVFTQEWPVFSQTHQLPTGDASKGFGHDRLGYEINLPFSKIVSDRVTLNFNAGGALFPEVNDRDLWNYNLGGSAIYAVTRDFNLMLEAVAFWEADVADFAESLAASATTNKASAIDRTVTALLSPGARYAFNCPNDSQIVVGAAVPIGLTSDSPDWGLFFYLSFEHPFVRAATGKTK